MRSWEGEGSLCGACARSLKGSLDRSSEFWGKILVQSLSVHRRDLAGSSTRSLNVRFFFGGEMWKNASLARMRCCMCVFSRDRLQLRMCVLITYPRPRATSERIAAGGS